MNSKPVITIINKNSTPDMVLEAFSKIGVSLLAHNKDLDYVEFANQEDLNLAVVSGLIEPIIINGSKLCFDFSPEGRPRISRPGYRFINKI